ncbi:MAG TPA: 2-dehydropantoate 2-reductase, partial [Thermoanaerobaculia bacterium]
MKIAVIGAGGVGGYFGGKLAHAGVDTTFIVRGATLQALRSKGLRVESVEGDFSIANVQATDDPASIGQVDAILLAVKAWQVAEVAATLRPMIGPDTAVVPLENGVEAPEILSPILGREHVLGGLCAIVSFIVVPGHIRHAAFEPFVMFGELDNHRSDRTTRLREAFLQAGVKADVPEDIHHSMWSKFLFITPMSGIGAITRVPVDVWRAVPELELLATQMLNEIIAVAAARGIALGDDAVARTWQRYLAMAPGSTASLQRDLMEGRPSELDAQLGAVVRLGRERAIPVPVTESLYYCLLPQERIARQAK